MQLNCFATQPFCSCKNNCSTAPKYIQQQIETVGNNSNLSQIITDIQSSRYGDLLSQLNETHFETGNDLNGCQITKNINYIFNSGDLGYSGDSNNLIDRICFILENINLHGSVLVSELAWGDLHALLTSNEEQKEPFNRKWKIPFWKKLIKKILIAIHHLGFVHDDLHLGNILIANISKNQENNDENNWIPLIHDFGTSCSYEFKQESLNLDGETKNPYHTDAIHFLESFIKQLGLPSTLAFIDDEEQDKIIKDKLSSICNKLIDLYKTDDRLELKVIINYYDSL